MRHDWIFEMLTDLRSYAQKNGLPALAAKADEALLVARAEIAGDEAMTPKGGAGGGQGGVPPLGRAH